MARTEEVIDFVRIMTDVIRYFEDHQIEIRVSGDFNALKDASHRANRKGLVTPPFDPARNDLLPHQAFWVGGFSDGETLVLTQAARLYDLGDLNLAEFCRTHIPRVFGDGEIEKGDAIATQQISGLVAYHGEGWVHPDYRSKKYSAAIGLFCQAIALFQWWPDYIFGMCEPSLEKAGFQIGLGYVHHEANALNWKTPAKKATPDAWLVWNSRKDIRRLIKQPLSVYL